MVLLINPKLTLQDSKQFPLAGEMLCHGRRLREEKFLGDYLGWSQISYFEQKGGHQTVYPPPGPCLKMAPSVAFVEQHPTAWEGTRRFDCSADDIEGVALIAAAM